MLYKLNCNNFFFLFIKIKWQQLFFFSFKKIVNNILIFCRLNHPNIIQLFDVVRLPEKLFIFLELCDSGDLKQLMAQKKTFSEKEVIPYIHQITSAFQTMYTNNIIHRDLKPANILLNKGNFILSSSFILA